MDIISKFSVNNLVGKGTKETRITIWDEIFKKYDRIGKENTSLVNVENIGQLGWENAKVDLKPSMKRKIVKKKRSRPRCKNVYRKNKRTKVLKLDNGVKCVVKDDQDASDSGVNLQSCVSEEFAPEITYINSIEEFQNHQELVVNLTNHNLFKTALESGADSDSFGEVLMEDDPLECDLIEDPNLVNEQNFKISNIESSIRQIGADKNVVQQVDSSALKKLCEMQKLEDLSDNMYNSTNLPNIEDQNCLHQALVSERLNKTPFIKCIPSKVHSIQVHSIVPLPNNKSNFDSEIKSNLCNGKYKGPDAKSKNSIRNESLSKRISSRSKKPNICNTFNNHKSLKADDIYFDVEKFKKKSDPDEDSRNRKGLQDFEMENCLGEKLRYKGTSVRYMQPTFCTSSQENEICWTKQKSVDNPIINETYVLKSVTNPPNIKISKEEWVLDSEIKSNNLYAKDKTDHNEYQNLKMENLSVKDLFYKRKQPNGISSSREVSDGLIKQSKAEKPMLNWLNKLNSETNKNGFPKTLKEELFKNLMHESNRRTLKRTNLSSYGQLDKSFQSSSFHMNSIVCSSTLTNTSTPIKDMEKLPSNRNMDEENYLNIKNKIENKFKSKLGYMAYNRHKLHHNNGASNKEEMEYWNNCVKQEIKRLSEVIPSDVLARYMIEYIRFCSNLSG